MHGIAKKICVLFDDSLGNTNFGQLYTVYMYTIQLYSTKNNIHLLIINIIASEDEDLAVV